MVIDTSAMVAVLLEEEDWSRYLRAMADAGVCLLSAANWLELCIVVRGRYPHAEARIGGLRQRLNIEIAMLDAAQAEIACDAFQRFGRGRHRAGLNFGDCFAYALAKARGEPLLFKGDDFGHTDIEPALSG